MREIKFRIINTGMIIAYEYLNQLGWFHVLLNNNTHYSGCFPDAQFGHKERCDRDQYTGLKDKNGKEIYEGDIVRAEGQTHKYIQIIEFHNSAESCGRGWIGRNIIKEESIVMRTKRERIDNTFSYFCWPAEWEIIGNIYENPELVNQKQQTY